MKNRIPQELKEELKEAMTKAFIAKLRKFVDTYLPKLLNEYQFWSNWKGIDITPDLYCWGMLVLYDRHINNQPIQKPIPRYDFGYTITINRHSTTANALRQLTMKYLGEVYEK